MTGDNPNLAPDWPIRRDRIDKGRIWRINT